MTFLRQYLSVLWPSSLFGRLMARHKTKTRPKQETTDRKRCSRKQLSCLGRVLRALALAPSAHELRSGTTPFGARAPTEPVTEHASEAFPAVDFWKGIRQAFALCARWPLSIMPRPDDWAYPSTSPRHGRFHLPDDSSTTHLQTKTYTCPVKRGVSWYGAARGGSSPISEPVGPLSLQMRG